MRSSCEGARRAHNERTKSPLRMYPYTIFNAIKGANSPSKFPSAAQSWQKRSIRGLNRPNGCNVRQKGALLT